MNAFEKSCMELANFTDDLSDSEKKFVLYLMLDYYKEGLQRDIQFEAKDAKDEYAKTMMRDCVKACETMRDAILAEIF